MKYTLYENLCSTKIDKSRSGFNNGVVILEDEFVFF